MRDRIKQHLKAGIQKQNDGHWLNDALSLRFELTLLDEDKPAADELLMEIVKPTADELLTRTEKPTRKRKWDEKQQVCYMVCANLIHARYSRKPLMVPMDQNTWAGKPFVPKCIRRLIKHKLVVTVHWG